MPAFEVSDPVTQQDAPLSPDAPLSTPPSILSRLRQETRAEHEAVEQVLDLMAASLTREGYRQRLEQFYGFYAPLEEALRARCERVAGKAGEAALPPGTQRALAGRLNKTAHLRQDLHCLGVMIGELPLCRDLPPLDTQAALLGCLYVLEGATLGGRMITQHVRVTLGITPTTGGRFFEGYGPGTGKMWQAMRQLLVNGAPDTHSENDIVASAIATFAALRAWCQSVQRLTATEMARHA